MFIHCDSGHLHNHLPGQSSRLDFHEFDGGQLSGSDDDWKLRNGDLFACFGQHIQRRHDDGELLG